MKQARSREASHDMHVVTNTRCMYNLLSLLFPRIAKCQFCFHFVCNAASDTDETVRRGQGMDQTSTARLTH